MLHKKIFKGIFLRSVVHNNSLYIRGLDVSGFDCNSINISFPILPRARGTETAETSDVGGSRDAQFMEENTYRYAAPASLKLRGNLFARHTVHARWLRMAMRAPFNLRSRRCRIQGSHSEYVRYTYLYLCGHFICARHPFSADAKRRQDEGTAFLDIKSELSRRWNSVHRVARPRGNLPRKKKLKKLKALIAKGKQPRKL